MSYDYDELNRLAVVSDIRSGRDGSPLPSVTQYDYDAVGNLAMVHAANGVQHSYTYNALNRLTNLQVRDILMNTLASYTYTLAPTGHRTGVSELGGRTVSYVYDNANRLTSETIGGATQSGTISYVIDDVGNRLQRNSTVAAVGSQWFSYNDNDLLDSDTYDANGNTTGADITDPVTGTEHVSDSYNFENRLVRRDKPDGSAIEILYNDDGDRVAKSFISTTGDTNTVWYLVDRNNLTGYAQVVEELQVSGFILQPFSVYTYGLDLIAQDRWDGVSQWDVSYYGYDGHSNVRLLTDEAGIVTDTYTFDAFGKLIEQQVLNPGTGALDPVSTINQSQVTINSYLFCGEQYDADLQMYFLRARYMDTDRGRFWTMDTFEGRNHDPATLHKYLYVHGDPVNGADPSGEMTLAGIMTASGIQKLLAATMAFGITAGLRESFFVILYHYTTDAGLSGIALSGWIAGRRGNWYTPDIYFSRSRAKSRLALEKAPSWRIVVRIYPLKDGLIPAWPFSSRVRPMHFSDGSFEPGGGREFFTMKPIPYYLRVIHSIMLFFP